MIKSPFPRTLKLLDGLRWTGKMTVESRTAADLFLVQFDAEDVKAIGERFIYDRTPLSGATIKDWTGQDPNDWDAERTSR